MNKQEFKNTSFGVNIRIEYKEKIYRIASINFEEDLIGLDEEDDIINWVRCENCKIVK